jgi:hypothetical protein
VPAAATKMGPETTPGVCSFNSNKDACTSVIIMLKVLFSGNVHHCCYCRHYHHYRGSNHYCSSIYNYGITHELVRFVLFLLSCSVFVLLLFPLLASTSSLDDCKTSSRCQFISDSDYDFYHYIPVSDEAAVSCWLPWLVRKYIY